MSSSSIENLPRQPLAFPLDRVSQSQWLGNGVESPDNIIDFPIQPDAPLWMIVDRRYRAQTVTFEARIRQRFDMATIDRAIEQEQPSYKSVQTLWKELRGRGKFQQPVWSQHSKLFGTPEMYTDPLHMDTIHGEMHQDKGRVLALVEILGQYKQLTPSEMKVLKVAAVVHDMARENDMEDLNHGLRAAHNVVNGKNYLKTFQERGMQFSEKEILQIQLLCLYHEKPWENVLPFGDDRMTLLIQTFQAADGLDRFRSPDPDWRPQAKFFMRFFDNDTDKITAAFEFAKHFALQSEKHRLEHNLSAEETMHYMLNHIGFLQDETPPPQPFGWSTLLRRIPYGGSN